MVNEPYKIMGPGLTKEGELYKWMKFGQCGGYSSGCEQSGGLARSKSRKHNKGAGKAKGVQNTKEGARVNGVHGVHTGVG